METGKGKTKWKDELEGLRRLDSPRVHTGNIFQICRFTGKDRGNNVISSQDRRHRRRWVSITVLTGQIFPSCLFVVAFCRGRRELTLPNTGAIDGNGISVAFMTCETHHRVYLWLSFAGRSDTSISSLPGIRTVDSGRFKNIKLTDQTRCPRLLLIFIQSL